MQFQARVHGPAYPVHQPDDSGSNDAVQRDLVHAVERQVKQARDFALDVHTATGEIPHQVPHGGVAAEIDQRAMVIVDKRNRLTAFQSMTQGLEKSVRLLVRGLSTRWYGPF